MDTRMLVLTAEYPPDIGGVATYISGYISSYSDRDILVYAPMRPLQKSEDIHGRITVLRSKHLGAVWPRWFLLVRRIISLVRKSSIDRIHVHHVLPYGYAALLSKVLFDIPYVVFLHGSDIFLASEAKRKKFMANVVFKHAERVVVGSQFLMDTYRERFSGINTPVDIVYPAVTANSTSITNTEIEELRSHMGLLGKKVFLTVARFVSSKGYVTLVNAVEIFSKKQVPFVCLFIGDGHERQRVADMVSEKGLQQYVRFVGSVQHSSLGTYWSIADVYIQLSEKHDGREEGFGLSFVEAGYAGLPVIGTRIGGIPEIVEDGVTGLLIDPGNAVEAAETMELLCIDADIARAYGSAGKQRVSRMFSWQVQNDVINKL